MDKEIYTLLEALGGTGSRCVPYCYGKSFREVATQLKDIEDILEVLKKANKPMRVKDICKAIPQFVIRGTSDEVLYQACNARLRLMRRAGLVERIEVVDKEHSIEVKDYNWRTRQYKKRTIEPTYAYYSAK